MSKRIKLLTETVINQIAAGEVIERPASILKELLENSIDANSTMIKIYIENGGISLIKVVDDGHGIHPDDLTLALVQHATSKINDLNDLNTITSLGFRGEALASIASVSKTNIISRNVIPSGTTIEVKDIFYNLPARKKFLRSSTTEYNYLQEMFKRIALSNYTIGFMLYHNHKLIKNLPPVDCNNIEDNLDLKAQRLSKLVGSRFINDAIFFSSKINNLQLCGWLSKNGEISSSQIQYFYINNRIVKDKLLNMAVKQAMEIEYKFKSYCLYLYIDPSFLDVNVHPTKQEVRFSEPKMVYAFVRESILEAVRKFETKINQDHLIDLNLEANKTNEYNGYPMPIEKSNNQIDLNPINNFSLNLSNNNKEQRDYNKINQQKWQQAIESNFNCEANNYLLNGLDLPVASVVKNINYEYKINSIFDNKYLIIESKEHPAQIIFLDVINSIKWLVEIKLNNIEQCKQYDLIIPERIKCSFGKLNQPKDIADKLEILKIFKFDLTQINHDVLLLRSIPDCLNILDLKINYANFFEKFFDLKAVCFNEAKVNQEIIRLLLVNLNVFNLNLYTKKDLLNLFEKLSQEKFNFFKINEQQFEKIIS